MNNDFINNLIEQKENHRKKLVKIREVLNKLTKKKKYDITTLSRALLEISKII